mgnify:CR=1 FL=1
MKEKRAIDVTARKITVRIEILHSRLAIVCTKRAISVAAFIPNVEAVVLKRI